MPSVAEHRTLVRHGPDKIRHRPRDGRADEAAEIAPLPRRSKAMLLADTRLIRNSERNRPHRERRCLPFRLPLSLLAMTSLDAGGIATGGGVRFLGQRRYYWRLLIRGAALLMVTLGIYRFWLTTDIRRFLWSNTEIAGEALEYTGTPIELLLGFLVAIAILIPVYAGFFLAALDLGILGKLSGVVAFAALGVLGQYAIYRARRYRLTRTIYRGLRFHQTGSAWAFAFRAMLWWIVTGLSVGLA